MSNSSVHSASRTFSTDQTAGCLFLQSVVKTVNSSSYIQNLYLCYLHIVTTFPSSSNLLKSSSTQEAKIRSFSTQTHLYTFSRWQHLIRKQMGLRFKRSEWIMSEIQQTSFTSFITCCTAKNVTTFVIISLVFPWQHVTLWMKRVITTAVAQSITLKLWLLLLWGQLSLLLVLLSIHCVVIYLQVTVYCVFRCPTFHPSLHSFVFTWLAISDRSLCALHGVHSTFSPCPLICGNLLLMLSFRVLHL